MNIHPKLFKLLRMFRLESVDHPGLDLLWCEMLPSGLALVAGIESQALTPISIDKLRIKNAWGSGDSVSFQTIYLLLQQVHPGTPSINTAQLPPIMSEEEAAAVQLQQREIKSEWEIWNDMDYHRNNPNTLPPSIFRTKSHREIDEALMQKRKEDSDGDV